LTRKRRRKRTAGQAVAPAEPSAGETEAREDPGAVEDQAPPSERPRGLWSLRASPYPPLGTSLARGFAAVAGSPWALGAVFASALLAWIVFLAIGGESDPQLLMAQFAIPPVNAFVLDRAVLFGAGGTVVTLLLILVGLGVLRAGTLTAVLLAIDQSLLGPERSSAERAEGAEVRARFPKVFVTLFAVYVLELTLAVVVQQIVAGFIGPLFLFPASIIALYFLALVPVVAAAEAAPARAAFRRGVRAARLPGTRHLTLVMLYAVLVQLLFVFRPGPVVPPATPGYLTWVIVLLVTVLHAGFLGALYYRWLVVRDEVPARRPAVQRERPR
jgi:hypothetical protein